MNVLDFLRLLGRSSKTPIKNLAACQEYVDFEKYKLESHQWGLVIAITPMAIVLIELGLERDVGNCLGPLLVSLIIVASFLASLVKLALVQVSRDRLRALLGALAREEENFKEKYISLFVLKVGDWLTLVAYLGLGVLVFREIWFG